MFTLVVCKHKTRDLPIAYLCDWAVDDSAQLPDSAVHWCSRLNAHAGKMHTLQHHLPIHALITVCVSCVKFSRLAACLNLDDADADNLRTYIFWPNAH